MGPEGNAAEVLGGNTWVGSKRRCLGRGLACPAGSSAPVSSFGAATASLVPEIREALTQAVFYTSFVKRCSPVVLRGAVANWPALRKWRGIDDLGRGGAPDLRVEVQESDTRDFVGTRRAARRSLGELAAADGVYRYLVQCTIWNRDSQGEPPSFGHLAEDVPVPEDLLRPRHVESVNVWVSPQETHSNPHYDTLHNLLCVVVGSKSVILMAPDATTSLNPNPVASPTSHHSRLPARSLEAQLRGALTSPALQTASSGRATAATALGTTAAAAHASAIGEADDDHTLLMTCPHQVCVLMPGDAVYIPEGWWHHVFSKGEPCTIGVNVWFECGWPPPHQHTYMLRRIVSEALWQRTRPALDGHRPETL